jgi:nucleotide-binding universal stress UspA family protein
MTSIDYRVICAVDGSAGSDRALDFVGGLPIRPHDEVIVASRPPYLFASAAAAGIGERLNAGAREQARIAVDAAEARLAAWGVRARSAICEGEDAVDALLRLAEREHASLFVAGSHGRGAWTSILLGSTARALAITSPIPVLIVRERTHAPVRVLAAMDGSPSSRGALAAFGRMPQNEGTVLELLHVLPQHVWSAGDIDWVEIGRRTEIENHEQVASEAMLASEKRSIPPGVRVRVRQERGHPGLVVLRRAEEIDADLIVVGTRGLRGPRQPFFGSTAERVLTHAKANVLVGPESADS